MRRIVRPAYLLFAAVLVLASCDAADNLMFDETPAGQSDWLANDTITATDPVTVPGDSGSQYTLVVAETKYRKLAASRWIDRDGGYVMLEGTSRDGLKKVTHVLMVPKGAVQQRTLFTMTVTSSHFIKVDLRAQIQKKVKRDRVLIDVGHNGFNTPVLLGLDHSLANVADRSRLTLLHDPENGQPWEDMHGFVFDGYENWVVAYLNHFSKYAVALD
jgi:hypothetical protein